MTPPSPRPLVRNLGYVSFSPHCRPSVLPAHKLSPRISSAPSCLSPPDTPQRLAGVRTLISPPDLWASRAVNADIWEAVRMQVPVHPQASHVGVGPRDSDGGGDPT